MRMLEILRAYTSSLNDDSQQITKTSCIITNNLLYRKKAPDCNK